MQTLKQTCFDLWKTNEERKGILPFKPIFIRYIGVENDEYEHILKTIDSQIKRNSEITLFFDGNIPTDSAVSQDVEFSDFLLNHMFSESIEYVLSIATKIDNYSTFEVALLKESLCKWTNQYVKTIDFNTNRNPKCIYYGNIAKEECYFLMLLYRMTFDVVYINPFEDCILKDIDENSLSECNIAEKRIPIDTWQTKIKDSDVISCDESYLYQMQEKIGTQLYGNGIYKPWQFKNYPIAPIEKLYTLMDIENNINEPAKIREGFYVDTVVHIPCFFAKIDGVYQNLIEENTEINPQEQNDKLNRLNTAKEMVSQRIYDLKIAENVAMQTCPMIQTMQLSNFNLLRKINSSFMITLPIFKQCLVQAIQLKKQEIQAKSIQQLDEKTNELLLRNAQNTVSQSINIAKMTGGSSIKIETLQETYETIKNGIEETKQITSEMAAKRLEDEKVLGQMKIEFYNFKQNFF